MQIRRLKLSGFKSFVEPAELRIEPGLTGIVGPNGCGKSNLLEAIRWAMGESSSKSLRGDGMDDVIFAGTSSRPARDFAEVTILLDRSTAEGGQSESEITRRIERGAGSAYRIDGGDVRAKDVALAVRRRCDRRAFTGAGQPGKDRRRNLRQTGRSPAAARGGGGHRGPSCAAQGRRAKACARPKPILSGSAKSCPTRSSAWPSSAARRGAPSATAN